MGKASVVSRLKRVLGRKVDVESFVEDEKGEGGDLSRADAVFVETRATL